MSVAAATAAGRLRTDSDFGQDRVREGGPRLLRPRAELEVGEAAAREPGFRVDPQERAAPAEVPERARRVGRAGPVRRLPVAQLEAEPPVVGVEPPEVGYDPCEPGELHRG